MAASNSKTAAGSRRITVDHFHQCFSLCMQVDRASGRIETVNGGSFIFSIFVPEEERMKLHVEYDDFGEYVEAVIDGELVAVKDCESDRRTVELILFEGTGAA